MYNAHVRKTPIAMLVVSMSLPMMACVASPGTMEDEQAAEEAAKKKDAGTSPLHWDLLGWELQLPTGKKDHPDIIDNPTNVHNDYFYVDTDDALTFMDPRKGWTTGGSQHPRSEMREITSGWAATGTNTLTADVQVVMVPSTVTIGQIFQAPNAPSKPLLELEYHSSGDVRLLLERDKNGSAGAGADTPDIASVPKGSRFRYQLSLSNNQIQITVGSTTKQFALPPTFHGEKFYFKAGAYDQTATEGAPSTTVGTLVRFFSIEVAHST